MNTYDVVVAFGVEAEDVEEATAVIQGALFNTGLHKKFPHSVITVEISTPD